MISLPNNCRCSELSIFPKNWKEPRASVKKPWYITYRFYDAENNVKQVHIRGMNGFKSPQERKAATQSLIDTTLELLEKEGYNPILDRCVAPVDDKDLSAKTPIIKALNKACETIKVQKKTRIDIEGVVSHVCKAVKELGLDKLQIGEVRKKHIKFILLACEKQNKKWSANLFNHYRKYLSILFTELKEFEAVEEHPIKDIAVQETVSKIKETLTDDERKKVNEHLKARYYRFWLFTQMFFHSGSRISELLRLKAKDVNLTQQYFKVTILKGKKKREVKKVIKDVALTYWTEALKDCLPEQYVFSEGLKPGNTAINPEQITRRWKRLVKDKLNINASFYSLKHLHSTELVDLLSEADAAKHNSHTGTGMVVTIYDTKQEKRQHERLRKINNEF
jgi:integrase